MGSRMKRARRFQQVVPDRCRSRSSLTAVVLALVAGTLACSAPDAFPGNAVDGSEEDLARALWFDVTDEALASTAEWSNKVELADLDDAG